VSIELAPTQLNQDIFLTSKIKNQLLMRFPLLCFILLVHFIHTSAQSNLYFPPAIGTWESTPPSQLGFCPERIDSLYQFLSDQNSKAFILLKDGKIVLEKYFDTFGQDSIWYWASAGKSLSAYLAGVAMEENGLQINAPVSQYLGMAWTSASPDKEALIKVRNLLTMTTGLNDQAIVPGVNDVDNCTTPQCLLYQVDAGTRWAYHNAPYRLVHDVLEAATGKSLNIFTKTRLFDRIGARGLWFDHVMYSNPRSMARFGLLALSQGIWNGDTILRDQNYIGQMSQSSQNLNLSYGYLWWLNGKPSFMLPDLQLVLPGQLFSNAPSDMYAALGKNDQKIHIVPSKNWVVVRIGDASNLVGPGGGQVLIVFDNQMWAYINALDCSVSTLDLGVAHAVQVSPNPSSDYWQLQWSQVQKGSWQISDVYGKVCATGELNTNQIELDARLWQAGVYFFKIGQETIKLIRS
jgi:CubicO group peptidase (beta-lactamase class C family)